MPVNLKEGADLSVCFYAAAPRVDDSFDLVLEHLLHRQPELEKHLVRVLAHLGCAAQREVHMMADVMGLLATRSFAVPAAN
jgi:hypothetical protein